MRALKQKILAACVLILILLTHSSCSERAPVDTEGNAYTAQSIHALIDDLGKFDINKRHTPRITELNDKRRAAVSTLSELGERAMPIIIERLQQIPELEQALMEQEENKESKQEMNWLLGRKADLIVLVGGSGNKEHGKVLLSIAETKVGTGKIRAPGLVLALRSLGAVKEEQVLLERLYKSPDEHMSGSGSLLETLLTMRSESDKELASRVAAWPLESRIKGRAVVLGARLGLKEPIISEIKAVLQRSDLPSEIRYKPYEVGLHLTALAELLPPDEYMAATADAKLLQRNEHRSVVRSAQQRNEFWWATAQEKDALVHQLVRNDECNNDILAWHYMLKDERIDLLLKTRSVIDSNMHKRQSQPNIEPYYEVGQVSHHRIQPAGYKLSAIDGEVLIENIPGYGMFD